MRLWGGRFEGETDEHMEALGASLEVDRRLCHADVLGSIAYAHALRDAGVLTEEECRRIESGLRQINDEWEAETFEAIPDDEDIHTAIERRLHELTGDLAGKLHTGRSRNDQVATDTRLDLLHKLPFVHQMVVGLLSVCQYPLFIHCPLHKFIRCEAAFDDEQMIKVNGLLCKCF